ncbi:MAG: polysaccharide biosynthesis C-terminal domain-containing protein, partial [Lachnospiraceae bacterium]|nr:polysaccharide biosynthesis C-terminal domain-containing protein [Lachnospiraceae bacterium]
HLKSILFLVAVNLAIELYSLMDVTMMNFLSGKESIAFYKYGHNIEKILLQIVNTFTMVLIPRITYCHKTGDRDEFNRLVSKAFKLILITSVPMIIGICFTADFLIVKMYGEAYLSSAAVLKLFSVLLLISPIGYLLGSRMLLVTDHENQMLISVGIGAMVNLIGNLLLIPRFQEYGATWASIISELAVMVVYVILGKKYFKLSGVLKTTLKVSAGAGIMFMYLFGVRFLPLNGWILLALEIAGAVIIYVLALALLKESVTREYLTVLRQKLERLRKSK